MRACSKFLMTSGLLVTTVVSPFLITSCSCSNKKPDTDDKFTVDNINQILILNHCNTFQQVIDVLSNHQIDIINLKLKDTNNRIVWDQDYNIVAIINNTNKLVYGPKAYKLNEFLSHLWVIVNPQTFKSDNVFSQYLLPGTYPTDITVYTGIDAGKNSDLNITIKSNEENNINSDEYLIANTNFCFLTIDNVNQNIKHFGVAKKLYITLDNKLCYEYGQVGNLVLTKGNIIAANNCAVDSIWLNSDNVSVKGEKSGYIGAILKTGNVKKDIDDLIDVDQMEIVPDKYNESQPLPAKTEMSGLGTEKSPYIINDRKNLDQMALKCNGVDYQYYKVVTNKPSIDCSNWEPTHQSMHFVGEFDGSNVIFDNLDCYFFRKAGAFAKIDDPEPKETVIKNMVINANIFSAQNLAAVARSCGCVVKFENIQLHGLVSGSNASGFVGWGASNLGDGVNITYTKATFKNCFSDATIVATGTQGTGFWFFNPYATTIAAANKSLITLEDSIFTGLMETIYPGENKLNHDYFANQVNWGQPIPVRTKYSANFIQKYGNIVGTYYNIPEWEGQVDEQGYTCFHVNGYNGYPKPDEPTKIAHDEYYPNEKPTVDNPTDHKTYIEFNSTSVDWKQSIPAETFSSVKAQNAVSAFAYLQVGADISESVTNLVKAYLNEDIPEFDVMDVGDTFTTDLIRKYAIRVNDGTAEKTGVDPSKTYFHIVDPIYAKTYSSCSATIVQLDAKERIIRVDTFVKKK